jgi:hypothetical protein
MLLYKVDTVCLVQCRLGRRPTPTEAIPCELLACGIAIISDAATLAADPDTLKKVCDTVYSKMGSQFFL